MLSSWWEIEESKGSPSDGLIWAQQNFINPSSHNHKSIHPSTLFLSTCHPFKIQLPSFLFIHLHTLPSNLPPIYHPIHPPFPSICSFIYPIFLIHPPYLIHRPFHQSMYACIHLPSYLSTVPPNHPFIYLSIHPFTHPYPICPPIHPLSHLYLLPLIHPSIPLSISCILTSTTSILPPITPPSGHLNVQN